jgi:hypothetical protein
MGSQGSSARGVPGTTHTTVIRPRFARSASLMAREPVSPSLARVSISPGGETAAGRRSLATGTAHGGGFARSGPGPGPPPVQTGPLRASSAGWSRGIAHPGRVCRDTPSDGADLDSQSDDKSLVIRHIRRRSGSAAKRRSAAYRTITVCGPKKGKLCAGACRWSREVRPGPSRSPVTVVRLVRWLIPDDELRRSRLQARSPPPVYGRSKNTPNTATLCHFSARPVRRLGGKYRDSSRARAGA